MSHAAQSPPSAAAGDDDDGAEEVLRIEVGAALSALSAMAAVVAEYGPDHVDPAAEYRAAPIWAELHGRPPARPRYAGSCPCLVGLTLARLGVPRQVLAAADLVTGCTRITHIALPGVELSDGTLLVLAAAQDAQDGAATWAQALTRACDTADRHRLLGAEDIDALTPVLAAALPRGPERSRVVTGDG